MVLWGITFFWSRRDVIWFEKFAHGLLGRTPSLFSEGLPIEWWMKFRTDQSAVRKIPWISWNASKKFPFSQPTGKSFGSGNVCIWCRKTCGGSNTITVRNIEPQAIDSVKAVKNVFLVITARRSGLTAPSPTFRGLQKSSCEVSRVSLPRHYPGGTSKVEIQSTKN